MSENEKKKELILYSLADVANKQTAILCRIFPRFKSFLPAKEKLEIQDLLNSNLEILQKISKFL